MLDKINDSMVDEKWFGCVCGWLQYILAMAIIVFTGGFGCVNQMILDAPFAEGLHRHAGSGGRCRCAEVCAVPKHSDLAHGGLAHAARETSGLHKGTA